MHTVLPVWMKSMPFDVSAHLAVPDLDVRSVRSKRSYIINIIDPYISLTILKWFLNMVPMS